ncbi:MAG: nucleoside deaminase [Chitinophagaceae bacterium]|nr:MAG: nucleoside deaminase [Chitinophagaceae bacterium]
MGKRELDFMQIAVNLSKKGMEEEKGGPFGAIVVKGDEVVGQGFNSVLEYNDPTAHAEVMAIRDACKRLNSFQLEGCEIYTSCEPCPMCLGAIYWARPDKIYYANDRKDAADAGFDDSFIYEEISLPVSKRSIPMYQIDNKEALESFINWKRKVNKTNY